MAHRPQIFAHRGAKARFPENTLPAFQGALDMGADGIELDVQASRDDVLMVLHDFDLSHTTNGEGRVADYTAAELLRLDAGIHFGADWIGTPMPTLEQVFDLVDDRATVNVEIKNMHWRGGREVELLIPILRRRELLDRVIVSSFNPVSLLKLRKLEPSVALGLLYAPNMPIYLRRAWLAPFIAPEALHPYYAMIDESYMKRAREKGQYVNTWTVNEVKDAMRLAELGVDVIMTDHPDRMIAAFEERAADDG